MAGLPAGFVTRSTTLSASSVDSYSLDCHQDISFHYPFEDMPILTFSQIADAFLVLMNTPLVPAEAVKGNAGRDVPLTDMPAGSRSSRERRRRSNDSSTSTDSSFSTSRFAPSIPSFTNPHIAGDGFEANDEAGVGPSAHDTRIFSSQTSIHDLTSKSLPPLPPSLSSSGLGHLGSGSRRGSRVHFAITSDSS